MTRPTPFPTRPTAGDHWDRAARCRPGLDRVQALLEALAATGDDPVWHQALHGLESLRALHNLGRPVCEGDTPSGAAITVQLDPMRSGRE